MVFESTFFGTQLECAYGAGAAAFRSDNVTTMSILKDLLSKEATMAKVALATSFGTRESVAGRGYLLMFVGRCVDPQHATTIQFSNTLV